MPASPLPPDTAGHAPAARRPRSAPGPLAVLARLLAASLGGYAAAWACLFALCAIPPLFGTPATPIPRASLWFLAYQLAPLPLLFCLLWAFAARTVWRAWSLPLAIAAVGTAGGAVARLLA